MELYDYLLNSIAEQFAASRVVKPDADADTQIMGTTGYAAPEQFGLKQTDGRAEDGGWLYPRDTTFRQNGVGLLYDSVRSGSYGCLCAGNRFLDNTVAIRLENMIPGVWLEPEKCTFRGNGTDIDNRGDFTVNMVDCTVS